jgi:hypothetical protein
VGNIDFAALNEQALEELYTALDSLLSLDIEVVDDGSEMQMGDPLRGDIDLGRYGKAAKWGDCSDEDVEDEAAE